MYIRKMVTNTVGPILDATFHVFSQLHVKATKEFDVGVFLSTAEFQTEPASPLMLLHMMLGLKRESFV